MNMAIQEGGSASRERTATSEAILQSRASGNEGTFRAWCSISPTKRRRVERAIVLPLYFSPISYNTWFARHHRQIRDNPHSLATDTASRAKATSVSFSAIRPVSARSLNPLAKRDFVGLERVVRGQRLVSATTEHFHYRQTPVLCLGDHENRRHRDRPSSSCPSGSLRPEKISSALFFRTRVCKLLRFTYEK